MFDSLQDNLQRSTVENVGNLNNEQFIYLLLYTKCTYYITSMLYISLKSPFKRASIRA